MSRTDIDFNFKPHPMTGDLVMLSTSQAIRQSLRNIVLTSFYERGFNVQFGTDVRSSLFELFSPLDLLTMQDKIIQAINIHEPAVEVIDVVVSFIEPQRHSIDINIVYTAGNIPDRQVVNLQLSRIR